MPGRNRATAREDVEALLARPFQVVAGKGGVGRTVVSCALALRASRQGLRTLLLEVNAPDSAAERLGVPPSVDDPREVLDNLWLCRMTPRGSMREYALMVLKFKALYALVFENKLVKFLLRSIPSLAEFTMLGKAWYHATETRPDGSPKYERVIVDAPATGHAITFLSVARTVADIVPAGIMKTAAERMAVMVESKESSCIHVVCLPEEMPVNEGLQIVSVAKTRLRMQPGLGIVNRLLPPLVRQEDRELLARLELRATKEPGLQAYVLAAKRRADKEAWQQDHAARFARESGLTEARVPDLGADRVDRAWIERMVSFFDQPITDEDSWKREDSRVIGLEQERPR